MASSAIQADGSSPFRIMEENEPSVATTSNARRLSIHDEARPTEIPTGNNESILKKLLEYTIIVLKAVATILILPVVCILSIPVAYIKINVETLINRYKHYKKYHPGTQLFRPQATRYAKNRICEQLQNHYNYIIEFFDTCLYTKNKLEKCLPSRIAADTAEEIANCEKTLDDIMNRIKSLMIDLHRNQRVREQLPKNYTELNESLNAFHNSLDELLQIISKIPAESATTENAVETNRKVSLRVKINVYYRWFSNRYSAFDRYKICPHCCDNSVSPTAEQLPYSLRSLLFTLHKLPYYPIVAPAMGVYRSAQMVLSLIWGTSRPINYFPWHPGEAHRFPFSTPEHKGMEGIYSDPVEALGWTRARAPLETPYLVPVLTVA
ncbi:hypothetical protein GCM10023116_36940 [Kistimonas scapharcae]|uniref:Uncharacterized protein n=1 Tax=Kistimonas scapharcae TaxID=1036133 RepID=A0ABP8V8S3_9GAMM